MTPEEKANELFRMHEDAIYEKLTYTGDGEESVLLAKAAAIITADEMIKIGWNLPYYNNVEGEKYWQAVKAEIEKL
jgi:hypothetical protein